MGRMIGIDLGTTNSLATYIDDNGEIRFVKNEYGNILIPSVVGIDENNEISIEFHVIIAYGVNISTIAENIISSVKYKVEAYTGMTVKKINIYVEGVRVID